jgi:hypothetical protein
MPLLDHFRPPLSTQRHWESLHTTWAATIADALNESLPEGYFAEEQLHPAARVEIDVATFEERRETGGAVTASARTYSPPAAARTIAGLLVEGVELLVFQSEGGPALVGALELVSPGNKDRQEARRAFAIKCASYLHQGIGLVVVDVVTSRAANLHQELLGLLNEAGRDAAVGAPLYATAYRPARRLDRDEIEIWPHALAVGQPLVKLPLWIGPELAVQVDLESTYLTACQRRRLMP